MSGLTVSTLKEVLGERSTGDNESLTREYNLLSSVLATHKEVFLVCTSLWEDNLLSGLVVILTHEEVFGSVQSTGENPSFSLWLTGELVLILPTWGFYQLHGEIFFTTHKRVASVPWNCEEVLP